MGLFELYPINRYAEPVFKNITMRIPNRRTIVQLLLTDTQ